MNAAPAALWVLGLLALQPPAPPAGTAEEVMGRVRRSTGLTREKLPEAGLELTGAGEFTGLPARYRVVFDRQGRFLLTTTARVSTASGYDGKRAWTLDVGGELRPEDLAGRDVTLFAGLLLSGMWVDPASGIRFTPKEGSSRDDSCTLNFSYASGAVEGTVKIDTTTWTPLECSFNAEGQAATYRWSGQIEYAGMKFPRRVTASSGGSVLDVMNFESARPAPPGGDTLGTPGPPRSDAAFAPDLPARLEVRKARTGHLLVRPKVNGKDVGWFILDTGAGANVLASSAAKDLGLEQFGQLPAIGVGGAVKSHWCRLQSFTLGRLTIQEPVAVAMDLSFLDAPLGSPIAGIVGYGTFHRSVLEVDLETPAVALYDPGQYDASRVGGRWQRLYQTARVACVEAEFEGHRGIFKLDTGAAGTSVAIHAPAVEQLKLLQGREVRDAVTGGVGGNLKAKEGVLKYFKLGGVRVENVPAVFATAREGAFNSATTSGNIGGDLVKAFTVVFDYPHQRIAFLKRAPDAR